MSNYREFGNWQDASVYWKHLQVNGVRATICAGRYHGTYAVRVL